MVICGQEFDFSALNANDIERIETAQQHLEQADAIERKRPKSGKADILRGQCRLVMDYLDEILGAGASERLGLDGNDFGACQRVIGSFKQAIASESASALQPHDAAMNRAQRRAQNKKPKHKAQAVEQTDKAARRKALLAELAALE